MSQAETFYEGINFCQNRPVDHAYGAAKSYRTGNAREFRWLQLGQGYLSREDRLGAEETRQPRQVA